MGNCLKGTSNEDISLLRGHETTPENPQATPQDLRFRDRGPLYYPTPNEGRMLHQLTEEEQMKLARRYGLIEHLPIFEYDDTVNKHKECVICMVEFKNGDQVRYLPCMHVYHVTCIDNWLMRSFTCPSCMEPVDAGLLTSYDTN